MESELLDSSIAMDCFGKLDNVMVVHLVNTKFDSGSFVIATELFGLNKTPLSAFVFRTFRLFQVAVPCVCTFP